MGFFPFQTNLLFRLIDSAQKIDHGMKRKSDVSVIERKFCAPKFWLILINYSFSLWMEWNEDSKTYFICDHVTTCVWVWLISRWQQNISKVEHYCAAFWWNSKRANLNEFVNFPQWPICLPYDQLINTAICQFV